eukprot:COSAG06_NODE_15250_length_1086_cov_0.952381_1_plen_358_part_10
MLGSVPRAPRIRCRDHRKTPYLSANIGQDRHPSSSLHHQKSHRVPAPGASPTLSQLLLPEPQVPPPLATFAPDFAAIDVAAPVPAPTLARPADPADDLAHGKYAQSHGRGHAAVSEPHLDSSPVAHLGRCQHLVEYPFAKLHDPQQHPHEKAQTLDDPEARRAMPALRSPTRTTIAPTTPTRSRGSIFMAPVVRMMWMIRPMSPLKIAAAVQPHSIWSRSTLTATCTTTLTLLVPRAIRRLLALAPTNRRVKPRVKARYLRRITSRLCEPQRLPSFGPLRLPASARLALRALFPVALWRASHDVSRTGHATPTLLRGARAGRCIRPGRDRSRRASSLTLDSRSSCSGFLGRGRSTTLG